VPQKTQRVPITSKIAARVTIWYTTSSIGRLRKKPSRDLGSGCDAICAMGCI
jgi:hypothetical protein